MNRWSRAFPVVFALLVLAIFIVPQYARAETQTQVTEIANFKPSEDNNDEVMNLANGTGTYNVDSWSPLPPGVFVGGTVKESHIKLNEIATGTTCRLGLATVMRFSQMYMQTGSSQFVIRLPVSYVAGELTNVMLWVYEMPTATYRLSLGYAYGGPGWPDMYGLTSGKMIAYEDAIDLTNHNSGNHTYVVGDRVYVKLTAPLFSDRYYVFVTSSYYAPGSPMSFYVASADLASDNLTSSQAGYSFWPDPGKHVVRSFDIPADLGWSFVFQAGIGNYAIDYSHYYYATNQIRLYMEIPTSTPWTIGFFNFVMEFRINQTQTLDYSLRIFHPQDVFTCIGATGGGTGWWTNKLATQYIVASNPVSHNFTATPVVGGGYLHRFFIDLIVNQPITMDLPLIYDMGTRWYLDTPYSTNTVTVVASNGVTVLDRAFFGSYSTCSLDNQTLNYTGGLVTHHSSGKWTSMIGSWWDEHWVDIASIGLMAGGMFLTATGVGAVFGVPMFLAGVGLMLYHNWAAFRQAVDGVLKAITDGLRWLGTWLWKIGQAIWAALTWFVDQLIDFGSQLIALIIYGLAVIVPVIILTMTTKLMSIFYKIAKGDLEGAGGESRALISTVTGGRVGGG